MNELKIENVDISTIKPNPANVNIHSSVSIDKIKKSIEAYGLNTPLGVRKDIVLVGNGRYTAIKALGWESVPIVRLDHLSDDEAVAYGIADNRVADDSFLDDQLLKEALRELENNNMDMDSLGFDYEELDELLSDVAEEEQEEDEEAPEIAFTLELLEENNYVVLKFNDSVSWLNLISLFELSTVKALDSKEDYTRAGVGRVIDGSHFLEVIRKGMKD